MRSSRPSAKAAQLELLREGEATVQVQRPYVPGVIGGTYVSHNARQQWVSERRPTQSVRISYQVYLDPLQLADLGQRSLRNKSGEATRGWASAIAGKASHNMTDRRYIVLAQHAANTSSLRAVEGPVQARVKLLDAPEPFTPCCALCHQPFEAHVHEERTVQGAWVRTPLHEVWDRTQTSLVVDHFCPETGAK